MRPRLRSEPLTSVSNASRYEFELRVWREKLLLDSWAALSRAMRFPLLIPLVAAICNFCVTLFVSSRGLRSTLSRVYLLWGLSITVWNFGTYFLFVVNNPYEALFLARFLQFGVIFIPVSLFHLSLLIAQIPIKKYIHFFYLFGGMLAVTNFTNFFIPGFRNVGYAYYSVAGPGF